MDHGSDMNSGRYDRLFSPKLRVWCPPGVSDEERDRFLLDFTNQHMLEAPGRSSEEIASDTAEGKRLRDDLLRFDSCIPAGYTYFGQFVDHDITFDRTPLPAHRIDPDTLHNLRTPRLDLDSVYGYGPEKQPRLYDQVDKGKMLIGKVADSDSRLRDLPRDSNAQALIGDSRNDENALVSQLHLAFLLAHNTLVDRARRKGMADAFEAARTTLRRLYQYVLWHDFVARITDTATHARALTFRPGRPARWELGFRKLYEWNRQPFMPVEFSAAAYRFGHSMVRNEYQTNDPIRNKGRFVPLFARDRAAPSNEPPDDLRGNCRMRARNVVQWDWFLKMTSSMESEKFPQKARKIDTWLANALAQIPMGREETPPLNILAYRNLKRGWALGLPAGTAAAEALKIPLINLKGWEPDALWYYILREAALPAPEGGNGDKLGQLGSTIVCATLAGLLKGDPDSYFNVEPAWHPIADPLLCAGLDNIDGEPTSVDNATRDWPWTLASVIRIARLPIRRDDFVDQH